MSDTYVDAENQVLRCSTGVDYFIDALGVGEVDLLGFSLGSFVTQEMALVRPATVRYLHVSWQAPGGAL